MAQVLSRLPKINDPRLLVGTETADDAGVYRLSDEVALVQTVDLFPPVVDDPYAFGSIAAANALSDVYAMGGTPLTALNLVGWPNGTLDFDILAEVMLGGADKLAEAGATLVGGHSWDDAEPKYGLSVTGLVHPQRIMRNSSAEVGDELVLTKPLGLGIITTGAKAGLVDEAMMEDAVAVMATLNRDAALAMQAVGAHSATDVTGFGLLGHLREMTSGSRVGAELNLSAIPIMEPARSLVSRDIAPAGSRRNLESLRPWVHFGAMPDAEQLLLADAQTSGGLLIAVAPSAAGELIRRLQDACTPAAARIGRIVEGEAGFITVEAG